MTELTPALLLRAYAVGLFPMAEGADSDAIYWFDPEHRGILPLEAVHVPRRLRRTLRQGKFEIRIDHNVRAVIEACAETTPERGGTWINRAVVEAYSALARQNSAHSVEAWHDNRLVGGLYGVALGGAFFGESMFSRERDASKVALVHLVARLRAGGFSLLDTQFVTDHLARFGAIEVSRAAYRARLLEALQRDADFHRYGGSEAALVAGFLQSNTSTS